MRKLLIAAGDKVLQSALTDQLRRTYNIILCADGGTAAELIRSERPDSLILELMLPVKDGFCVLEETADVRPSTVLCICDFSNDYIAQTAQELGVGFMFRKPCHPRVIASRLEHLMNHAPSSSLSDGQSKAAQLLLEFRFNPKNDGFRFLKIGIPLYAQDPQQRICKELYVSIASICGAGSWNQVERSIRSAIDGAWRIRADAWQEYFPDCAAPPTGKRFISRLAQILMDS
ncbi:MAG: hypothetical protein IJZ39_02340 [Oscillospiraceae bacterium]|nr:hypothetical protein [Oscillospiraceae bacterium]